MRHLLLLLSLIVLLPGGVSAKVTPLGIRPEWKRFDGYQETITRSAFVDLLDSVYAPHGAWKDVIKISGDSAKITTDPDFPPYVLRFAASSSSAKPVPRFW